MLAVLLTFMVASLARAQFHTVKDVSFYPSVPDTSTLTALSFSVSGRGVASIRAIVIGSDVFIVISATRSEWPEVRLTTTIPPLAAGSYRVTIAPASNPIGAYPYWSGDLTVVSAPEGSSIDRILIPLATTTIPGAFGSLWSAELYLRNDGDHPVTIWSPAQHSLSGPVVVPPHTDSSASDLRLNITPSEAILHVQKRSDTTIRMNLRVRDLSRSSLSAGTEVPLVREVDASPQAIDMLNVPMDSRFRAMVRIFDVAGAYNRRARVSVFPMGNDAEICSADLTLASRDGRQDAYSPGIAVIGSLSAFCPQAAPGPVRVHLETLDDGIRLWGFASVTNNETQEVTTISGN